MARAIKARLSRILLPFLFVSPLFAQSFRFAVIADTHIGSGEAAAADLRSIVDAINAQSDIGFVVHTGDITEKGRDVEFAEAKSVLDRLNVSYAVIPGNHDSHWVGYGLAGYRQTWGADRFSFERGGRWFIGLNTWEFGHLAPEDLSWLAETAARIPDSAPLFVFTHDPPEAVDNWFKARTILRNRRVLVISGHVHKTQVLASGGMPVVTARAAIRRGLDQPWGYLVLTETSAAVEIEERSGEEQTVLAGAILRDEWRPVTPLPEAASPAAAGRILWETDLGALVLSSPVVTADAVYVASLAGRISCLDLSGRTLWTHEAGQTVISRPATLDDALWIATAGGRISRLDRRTGRVLGSTGIAERTTSQLAVFSRGDGGAGLLVGTASGRMFCLDAASLERLWTSDGAAGMIQTRPLVAAGRVVFGSWDGHVHCLDAASGRELWSWTENPNFYYSPAGAVPSTDGRLVFVCSPDGFVTAVDLAAGTTRWRERFASWESLGLSADGSRVLVKSRLDEFDMIEAATGRLIRRIAPAHGAGDLMPVELFDRSGACVFGGDHGFVYKIDQSDRFVSHFRLGAAGVHTIQPLPGGIWVAVTMDGRVTAFALDRP